MARKQLGMLIDLKRCVGCNTCTVACKAENNLPNKIWWNRTLTIGGDEQETPSGIYPNLKMEYLTLACQHCENPACTRVCPVGATRKREEDGVVIQDPARCIGCRMCIAACPYTGVRSFNWDEPSYSVDFAVGSTNAPSHEKHTVEKCLFCPQRLEKGEEPVCVVGCMGLARHFGDLNDTNSKVSQILASRDYMQLLPEKGTNPSVYYLV